MRKLATVICLLALTTGCSHEFNPGEAHQLAQADITPRGGDVDYRGFYAGNFNGCEVEYMIIDGDLKVYAGGGLWLINPSWRKMQVAFPKCIEEEVP